MGEMIGERIEVEVTAIAHGGISVARLDGRVVFVSDAIPGETVAATVTDDAKKSFLRADTVEVLSPSPHRREHVWPEASVSVPPGRRAGGAEFGHIELGHQRELKRQVLTDALARMAGLDHDVRVEALPSGASATGDPDRIGTGWRTRVRLQVAADGTPGPYAARSHRVVPIASHPLVVPEAASVLPLRSRFPGARSIEVVVSSGLDPLVLVDGGRDRRPPITETVAGRRFQLDAGGFWQVHRHAAAALTSAVQSAVDDALFDPAAANLDLYGGVGLLAAAVGDRYGPGVRITSVESSRAATAYAASNLAEWPHASAVTASADRYLEQVARDAGSIELARMAAATVVLDPPRSGAGRRVVDALAALRPAQLVYVACDPVALARDVGLLAGHGYELRAIRGLDMFPHTHHVEAVATLVRASG